MYYDQDWDKLTSDQKKEIKKAHGGAGTGAKEKWKAAKKAAQSHQSQSEQRETKIDKPEADGTGGLHTDKKWSKLTKKEKKEIKDIHAQGPDGPFKGAKDSWQHQRAKSMGFDSEQDKKDAWTQMRQEAASRANNHQGAAQASASTSASTSASNSASTSASSSTATEQTTSSSTSESTEDYPTPEELGMKYKDDNYYRAIGVETDAMKAQRETREKRAAYNSYNPNSGFDDPNSHEAIMARQEYSKERRDGERDWNDLDVSQRYYDTSVNDGYAYYGNAAGHSVSNFDGPRNAGEARYKEAMEEAGLEFDWAGRENYTWDAIKGYYVPNSGLRQQRASMYDNTYARGGSDRASLGDRNEYIHNYYDPLNGVS